MAQSPQCLQQNTLRKGKVKMKRFLTVLTAMSLLFLPACDKEASVSQNRVEHKATNNEDGVKAYNFTLYDTDGNKISLDKLKGKVVILQFFGTYCPPCKAEIPVLEKLYKKYGGKVVVIGLSVDYMGEPPQKLKPFVEQMGITYPVVVSDEKTWEEYAGRITGMDSIPQTYIIDKEGYVRYYEVGFTPSYESLFDRAIQELLKG